MHGIVEYPMADEFSQRKICYANAPNVDVSKVVKVQRVGRDGVVLFVFSGSKTASGWKELPSSQLNHPGLVSR